MAETHKNIPALKASTQPSRNSGNSMPETRAALKMLLAKNQVWGVTDSPAVLEAMKLIRQSKTNATQAEWAVLKLRGLYGERALGDAEVWTAATLKVFMEYPFVMVEELLDPVVGIASQMVFFPGVPDVSKRLREMKEKIDRLNVSALAHMPIKRAEPEPDPREGTTAEERRATVLKALGRAPQEKTEIVRDPHPSVRRTDDAPGNQDGSATDAGGNSGNLGDNSPGGDAGGPANPGQ